MDRMVHIWTFFEKYKEELLPSLIMDFGVHMWTFFQKCMPSFALEALKDVQTIKGSGKGPGQGSKMTTKQLYFMTLHDPQT
jgi:hypothetical protein